MKLSKQISRFVLAFFLSWGILVFVPPALNGCAKPGVHRQAVNTLFTTGYTVDTAYKSYLDLVVRGELKTNDVPRVSRAYMDFQKAFAVAVELAAMNTNAPPSSALLAEQAKALSVINSAGGK